MHPGVLTLPAQNTGRSVSADEWLCCGSCGVAASVDPEPACFLETAAAHVFQMVRDLWVAPPVYIISQICSCALGTQAVHSIPERPSSAGQAICVLLRVSNTVLIKSMNSLFD